MIKKYFLTAVGLLLAVAANAYVTNWPLYGEVYVEDIAFADDNSTIVNNFEDCYYDYQYCPAKQIAVLRHIFPSNASGERDFVLVPPYIIVEGVAYPVVGVNGALLGNEAQSIKNIYLHNELEFLGSRALSNAIAVQSITIPGSVKSISYDIFSGLGLGVALTSITFEDNAEPLVIDGAGSAKPFANLPLTSIYIGRNFSDATPFGTTNSTTVKQTLVNLTMGGTGTQVTPEMFSNFKALTTATLKPGVVGIGEKAFYKCPKLQEATMSSVATIGTEAFSGDSAMTTLDLGSGVSYIDDYAFYDCKRVASLTLPASLDSLHVRAFVGMTSVQSLTIADSDRPLALFGIGAGFYGSSLTSHLTALETAYMGRNLLPTHQDSRKNTAFYEAGLKQLTVGDHVTALGTDEFNGCKQLEQVQLGSKLASIGEKAFYNNTSLRAITIPDRVTHIGTEAFSGDTTMTTLNIGSAVSYIGDYAFNDCKRVASLTLPASLDSLHVTAFVGMTGVQSLTIADTNRPLTLFGAGAGFYGSSLVSHLTALETAYMGRNILPTHQDNRKNTAFYEAALKRLTMGDHVTALGTDEFYGCQSLEQVQLGSKLESIGEKAFYNNSSLRAITIPDRVTHIGTEAFSGDTAMTTLDLGSGVSYIGYYAFNDCKRVASLTLPASLDSLDVTAFVGMTGVQSLTISDTDRPLTLFGVGAGFYGNSLTGNMTALETAYMGRHILPTQQDNRKGTAFHSSTIKQLTIGKLVNALNADEFNGCTSLALINSMNPTPPVCADATAFSGVDKTACALHVPLGCKRTYQAAPVWEEFFNVTDDLPNDNPVITGDLNGDGIVDVDDLNILINIMLGNADNNPLADLNGDNTVDVDDLNILINIMLGKY